MESSTVQYRILQIKSRYNELHRVINDPASNEGSTYACTANTPHALYKEYGYLARCYSIITALEIAKGNINELTGLIDSDKDFEDIGSLEIERHEEEIESLYKDLSDLLMPQSSSSNTDSIILEVRAGVGGQEAALFALDILEMYKKYSINQNWKFDVLDIAFMEQGGIREAVGAIKGKGVLNYLRFESGVHRVQRVPVTESSGRIHTSAASVAVLNEPDDVDLTIHQSDLTIETVRSQGAGGQHVNTTDSAVRITHIPTGIVAKCQDEKSQIRNKEKAMKILRARIFEHIKTEDQKRQSQERREQIGEGDRSEKVRTYNFPQSRVTDHRIGFTSRDLEGLLNGNSVLTEMTELLYQQYKVEMLSNTSNKR